MKEVFAMFLRFVICIGLSSFSNLADGSTFTLGGDTLQVNYEGGDGNDLTLTVQ